MKETSLFRTILDNMTDGALFVDGELRISLWNAAATGLTGYSPSEAINHFCHQDFLCHLSPDGQTLCEGECPLRVAMVTGQPLASDMLLRHKSGHLVPVHAKTIPVYSGGNVAGAVQIFSPQQVMQGAVLPLQDNAALRDPASDMPNRGYLDQYIGYKLEQAQLFSAPFCVLFADIDDFSIFNAQYGEAAGEAALRSISESFRFSLRSGDVVGRWGGEEFVGVFHLGAQDNLAAIAERIRMLISRSGIMQGNIYVGITASIGLTQARPGDTVSTLVQRAESYMLQSKQRGKNSCTVEGQAVTTLPT